MIRVGRFETNEPKPVAPAEKKTSTPAKKDAPAETTKKTAKK